MDQIKMEELEQKINSQYGNTTGIVIIKNGIVSYEKYFKGCTADSRVHVYSVTKSVISILFGIALDKGYIKNMVTIFSCHSKFLNPSFSPDNKLP